MTAAPLPNLRPLSMGELLDQVIRLYRRNFLTFIGIVAIVQIPLTLLQMVISLTTFGSTFTQLGGLDPFEANTGSILWGVIGTFLVAIISFILVQGVATAALTRAVADQYLGQKISILGAYDRVGRSWVSLIAALLFSGLLGIGLFIWLLIPCIGWFTGLGILSFFTLAVVPLITPTIVLEHQPASAAWRRAWELARRRFWWVIGFVFLLFILNMLITSGPSRLVSLIFTYIVGSPFDIASSTAAFTLSTIIQTAVTLLFSLIYLPLQLTGITLMYFDLRVRTEGFDLALMAQDLSGVDVDTTAVTAKAIGGKNGDLVTSNEMGYFVVLSVGAFVVFFILGAVSTLFLGALTAGGGF